MIDMKKLIMPDASGNEQVFEIIDAAAREALAEIKPIITTGRGDFAAQNQNIASKEIVNIAIGHPFTDKDVIGVTKVLTSAAGLIIAGYDFYTTDPFITVYNTTDSAITGTVIVRYRYTYIEST